MLKQMNIMELENKKNTTGEKGPSIDKTEAQQKSFEEDTAALEIVLSVSGQNQAVFSHFVKFGTFSIWTDSMDILQTC
ncbi:Ylp Motif-Containing Protein 1 [Manis pentadactyla]|nr:Ylp Motif-Containing Protein 1 [Manis pentadactyla]